MTVKIKLQPHDAFMARGVQIPGSVWKEKPFNFSPSDFTPKGCPELISTLIASTFQEASLAAFLADPLRPIVYGVGSAPADNRAKYFAAFLVQEALKASATLRVAWENLTTVGTKLSTLPDPDFLVITNVFRDASPLRVERLRDLLEMYDGIPRVVVTAGTDPFSMVTGRTAFRLDALFFHAAGASSRADTV